MAKLYNFVQNNGDGSASAVLCNSKELAELYGKLMDIFTGGGERNCDDIQEVVRLPNTP